MKFLSVCSGIEAASVAWGPLGWHAAAFSEIEPFPSAVLAHHYPHVPNLGDMTKFQEWSLEPIDLLCGGTPCQSFSVAGLRKGLADPRGNLMLTFGAIAAKYRPRWLVWENVPGVLSSNGGRDFGSFLGLLGQLGYGFAYRVLDAQYFGVAQRRRRVFVVGCLGDWRSAAAVLFERHSLSGHPAPRREAGARVVAGTLRSTQGGSDVDHGRAGHLIPSTGDVSHWLNAGGMGRQDYETETLVTHTLRAEGFDASEDGTGRGTPLVPVEVAPTLRAGGNRTGGHRPPGTDVDTADSLVPVAFAQNQRDELRTMSVAGALAKGAHAPCIAFPERMSATQSATTLNLSPALCAVNPTAVSYGIQTNTINRQPHNGGNGLGFAKEIAPTLTKADQHAVAALMKVRRLTPEECEALQGFPRLYTAIPWRGKPADQCPDGPRYKALGNSWAVPNARWIGERIAAVDQIISQTKKAA